uniref:Mutant internexin alpha n=1 Tax=Homo sapiens TaxID=9606 RepID=Q96J72_HUMAN|nr:mutant internexin alpha [Homo sapiens]
MPFTSAKCRIFCHQNTMLPPQSKRNHFWSINTTSVYIRKTSFSFLKDFPNTYPMAAQLVGSCRRGRDTQTREGVCMRLLAC